MIRNRHSQMRVLLAALAVTAALPIAGCNQQPSARSAYDLPDLPATLPLAVGEPSAVRYAPAVAELPDTRPLAPARVADPRQYYAYADNAWGFEDVLDQAPPDYGFYYDDVEPWAWQGYDDSLIFVEPLEYGYRTYYYRPGFDEPYFIRDPDWGYGYDNGRLAVVYGSDWDVVPYDRYGPQLSYASRYFTRGRDLYRASRGRHPVIANDWVSRRDSIFQERRGWTERGERQQAWQEYRRRDSDRVNRHWAPERARRGADEVRFAAWQQEKFRTPPPPRAIPSDWKRAAWAKDDSRFSPPDRGFAGNASDRARAADRERMRIAAMERNNASEQRTVLEQRRGSLRQSAMKRGEARQDVGNSNRREAMLPEGQPELRNERRNDQQIARRAQQQTDRTHVQEARTEWRHAVFEQRQQARAQRPELRQRSEQRAVQGGAEQRRQAAQAARQVRVEERQRQIQRQQQAQERQRPQAERQQAVVRQPEQRQERVQTQAVQLQPDMRQVERRQERVQARQRSAQQQQQSQARAAERAPRQQNAAPHERQQARAETRQARQDARNERRD